MQCAWMAFSSAATNGMCSWSSAISLECFAVMHVTSSLSSSAWRAKCTECSAGSASCRVTRGTSGISGNTGSDSGGGGGAARAYG
eukprot:NODE_24389_length_627_cov_2.004000.p4 GENE.NODE_24389_length_627_cov_2.004000~~NODE_24389_length_627_cov_2.004000.p4  ORF type:complete len:85 (+),score=18.98 NODE_24389_length_627_cov_2.004000:37-291(+)